MKQEIYQIVDQFNKKLQEIQRSQISLAKNQELLFQQNNKIIESQILLIKSLNSDEDDNTRETLEQTPNNP